MIKLEPHTYVILRRAFIEKGEVRYNGFVFRNLTFIANKVSNTNEKKTLPDYNRKEVII